MNVELGVFYWAAAPAQSEAGCAEWAARSAGRFHRRRTASGGSLPRC